MFGEKDMFYKKHSQQHNKASSEIKIYREESHTEPAEEHHDGAFDQEQASESTINRASRSKKYHSNLVHAQQNEFGGGESIIPIQRSSRNGHQLHSDKF